MVRNKSKFNPKKGRNMVLDIVCETLENLSLKTSSRELRKNNLSKEENKALESLTKDESIIIKEADKGGADVIMDRNYYETKIIEMLLNPEFYSEMSENQNNKTMQKIKRLLLKHSSVLTEKEAYFVTNFNYKESCF